MSDGEVEYKIEGKFCDDESECDRLRMWFVEWEIFYEGNFGAWQFEATELDPAYLDFNITLFGIPEDADLSIQETEGLEPLSPISGSRFRLHDKEYHVWFQSITRKNRAGHIEALWHPIIEHWCIGIKGIQAISPCERVETAKLLAEGLPLVEIHKSYNKTRGDLISVEVFRERTKLAVKAMARAKTPLNKKTLAKQVALDRNTIKKYLDRDAGLMKSLHALYQTELNG